MDKEIKEILDIFKNAVDLNRDRYTAGGEDNYNAILEQAKQRLNKLLEQEYERGKQDGLQSK